jgi:hypothetical protein
MVHVGIRASSTISVVETADTEDGTISPCRLKFTAKANVPSGVSATVAGNMPSSTRPATRPVAASIFHRNPNGWPWAVLI